jgi:hypothetical protein
MTCFLASGDHEEFNVKGYIEAVFIISPCDFQFKLRVLCNTQYGGTVSWKLFQTSYCGEFYNRGKVYCRFRSDKQDVESYSSFMNLVWFQDGFCQWDTTACSCSITQSEESRFDLWFAYIPSQVHTKYEFCESVKTRGYAKIHTELKSSDPLDIQAIPQAKHIYTGVPQV